MELSTDGNGTLISSDPRTFAYADVNHALLRAYPKQGSAFADWEGDIGANDPYEPNLDLFMDQDKVVMAVFCPKVVSIVGDNATLRVPDPVAPSSTFEWSLNGTPLDDIPGKIDGVDARQLVIRDTDYDDSGLYTCTYNDGSKTWTVHRARLEVVDAFPCAGAVGLIALATLGVLVCARGLLKRREAVPRR